MPNKYRTYVSQGMTEKLAKTAISDVVQKIDTDGENDTLIHYLEQENAEGSTGDAFTRSTDMGNWAPITLLLLMLLSMLNALV